MRDRCSENVYHLFCAISATLVSDKLTHVRPLSTDYKLPLPEDNDLQCFLPLSAAYSQLQFQKLTLEGLPDNTEVMLRCQRIVEHGLALAEDFPRFDYYFLAVIRSLC